MANQYLSLYILLLLVGMCFCALDNIAVVVRVKGSTALAMATICFGHWKKDDKGQLILTGAENSTVSFFVNDSAFVSEEKVDPFVVTASKFKANRFDTDSNDSLSMTLSQPLQLPANEQLSYEVLEAEVVRREDWVTLTLYPDMEVFDEDISIVFKISAGVNGTAYPDVRFVSIDGNTIELFGYYRQSVILFLGDYAEKFQREAQSVKVWTVYFLKMDETQTNVTEEILGEYTISNTEVTGNGSIVVVTFKV